MFGSVKTLTKDKTGSKTIIKQNSQTALNPPPPPNKAKQGLKDSKIVHSPPVKDQPNGSSSRKLSESQQKRLQGDKENQSMNVTTTTHNGSATKKQPDNFRTSFEEKLYSQQVSKEPTLTSYSKERMVQRNITTGGGIDERSLNNSFNVNGSYAESFAARQSAHFKQASLERRQSSNSKRQWRGRNGEYTLHDLEKLTNSMKKEGKARSTSVRKLFKRTDLGLGSSREVKLPGTRPRTQSNDGLVKKRPSSSNSRRPTSLLSGRPMSVTPTAALLNKKKPLSPGSEKRSKVSASKNNESIVSGKKKLKNM